MDLKLIDPTISIGNIITLGLLAVTFAGAFFTVRARTDAAVHRSNKALEEVTRLDRALQQLELNVAKNYVTHGNLDAINQQLTGLRDRTDEVYNLVVKAVANKDS